MARAKLTAAERRDRKYRAIVRKADKGKPVDQIASEHDLSVGRVYNIIKEHPEHRAG